MNNDRFFEESNGLYSTYNQSRRLLYDRWKKPGDITDIPRYGVTAQLDDRFLELLVPAPQEPDTGIRTAATTAEKDQFLHLGTRIPARTEPADLYWIHRTRPRNVEQHLPGTISGFAPVYAGHRSIILNLSSKRKMIKKFKLYIMLVAVALSSASCLDKMPEDGIPFERAAANGIRHKPRGYRYLRCIQEQIPLFGQPDAAARHTDRPGVRSERQHQRVRRTSGAGKSKSNPPIPTSKPCTVRCTMLSTAATSCSTVRTPYGKRPPTTRTSTSWTSVARLTLPVHLPTGTGEALLQGIRKR